MTIGVSDGTTFKDSNEWLADAFKQTDSVSQMKEQGNIDLTARPQVKNEDGSVSTVRSMSIGTDQGEVLIPTVAHDGSRVLSDDEAVQQYRDSGKHLGIFQTPEQADKYAEMLHKSQADLYTGRPLGAPGEPADALNQAEGSQTPAKLSVLNSVRGMANPSFDEDKKILGGIYEGVKSALTLPGDVYSGKVPAGSVQEIERATDLAGLAIGGPAPVAAKMADGTLGSFAGVVSKTVDKGKLYEAQNLALEGTHPDDIWKQTGFFKGADQRWRYEIPDNSVVKESGLDVIKPVDAVLDPTVPKGWQIAGDLGEGKPSYAVPEPKRNFFGEITNATKLKDVLDHPELYKAYPELANTKVLPMPQGVSSFAHAYMGDIYMSPMAPETFHDVLTHEVQHIIQGKEGFSRGGNSREFTPPGLKDAEENFKKVKANTETELKDLMPEDTFTALKYLAGTEAHGIEPTKTVLDHWRDTLDVAKETGVYQKLLNNAKSEKLLAEQKVMQEEKYMRIRGEVEARNVTRRMDMGTMERFLNNPTTTEDRPRFVQIDRGSAQNPK